ncbi:MAG: hypothetical protein FJW20_02980 [Acidimicrobiia bacterium]|nr:hypothetical protein [Acidimicrobiia bacterium]
MKRLQTWTPLAIIVVCATTMAAGVPQWLHAVLQLSGPAVAASHAVLSEHEREEINTLPEQEQAYRLLNRAINGYKGALEEIESRVQNWTGKIELDEKLNSLTGVAYCSHDLRVRAAAVEISLAGYGLEKSPRSVDEQIEILHTGSPQKFYALWKLGLLGNRGVEPHRARQTLVDFLHDRDIVNRRWAVNGLGVLATADIIEPLIEVFRTDESPEIRERAACNLADAGLMTKEQRMKSIPYLLSMTDDVTLDSQTRGWVFQALREISGQQIGSEPASWRNWWARAGH